MSATLETATRPRAWRLGRRARRTLLTVHIVSGVGLLGATAATLLLAVSGTTTDEASFARAVYRLMSLNSAVFGIPLSMLTLVSGVVLGLGTHWGVLRHWWTTAKLGLILGVVLNGALVIGPSVAALEQDVTAAGTAWRLVVAAALSVAMLLAATGVSVFKPGGRRSPR